MNRGPVLGLSHAHQSCNIRTDNLSWQTRSGDSERLSHVPNVTERAEPDFEPRSDSKAMYQAASAPSTHIAPEFAGI